MSARLQRLALPRLPLVAAALGAVSSAAFGWYTLHGGFYSDDWGTAADYRFAHGFRYAAAVRSAERMLGGRPLLAAFLPVPHVLFGVHPALHIAFGVLLVLTTCVLFYVVLRVLGVETFDAFAIAVLALLFPWADAIELWPTASVNTIAVIFFFVGVLLASHGLTLGGRRAWLTHGAAGLCFLLSVLTYEVAGAAALLVGFLYLHRLPLREALPRWAVDIAAVATGLVYSLVRTAPVRHVGGLHERIVDVRPMAQQAVSLLASATVPAGGRPVRLLVLLAIALVVVLVSAQVRRKRCDGWWLAFTAASAVIVGASYFMFLGSFLHPLDAGPESRINVFARFAYAALVYGIVATAALLLPWRGRVVRGAIFAAVALVAAGYVVRLARDERARVDAARRQRHVLAVIDGAFPHLSHGTTVATFGAPSTVYPEAPVFLATWDLVGAVQIRRGDRSLRAEPIYDGVSIRCTPSSAFFRFPGSRGSARARYGKLYFLDVRTRRSASIGTRAACRRGLRSFTPGPKSS